MQNSTKKFEICIVSKEYRWIEIEAEDDVRAIELAWDKVVCGYVGDTQPEDTDTEVYLEGEVTE